MYKDEFCYDCGFLLSNLNKSEIDTEHIPAASIFKNTNLQLTNALITINCRKSCNNSYSHLDDELRNYISILEDGKSNQKNLAKTIRSIGRKNISRFKPTAKGLKVSFKRDELIQLNEKNFKGLYYFIYKEIFDYKNFRFFHLLETDNLSNLTFMTKNLYDTFIKPIPNWEVSGHENIFRFKIIRIAKDKTGFKIASKQDEMIMCMCSMVFLNIAMITVLAIENKFGDSMASQFGSNNPLP